MWFRQKYLVFKIIFQTFQPTESKRHWKITQLRFYRKKYSLHHGPIHCGIKNKYQRNENSRFKILPTKTVRELGIKTKKRPTTIIHCLKKLIIQPKA